MLVGKHPQILIEALCVHIFLSHLGYSLTNEVFLVISEKDIAVQLQAEGRQTAIRVGTPEIPPLEMKTKWTKLLDEWNTGNTLTPEEKNQIFLSSQIYEYQDDILTRMIIVGYQRWMNIGNPKWN